MPARHPAPALAALAARPAALAARTPRPATRAVSLLIACASLLAATLLPGCAAPPRLVHVAPPAVRGETRPPRPGPGYVWVPGRWDWRDGRHEWAAGHWIQGKPGRIWVPGHWRRLGDAWTWEPGRWEPA